MSCLSLLALLVPQFTCAASASGHSIDGEYFEGHLVSQVSHAPLVSTATLASPAGICVSICTFVPGKQVN